MGKTCLFRLHGQIIYTLEIVGSSKKFKQIAKRILQFVYLEHNFKCKNGEVMHENCQSSKR